MKDVLWWEESRYRMIQNNLRDIDISMDIDCYIKRLKDFEANVCMVGCGGITAFYPSKLGVQGDVSFKNRNFFGELVEKAHKNGIRVIARFDFSKTHACFLSQHPEWFSKDLNGDYIYYHDTVATCINGDYQQHLSMEILKEVITEYKVDGVFFNMFGYHTYDYSNRYVGICQCDSCKERFRELYGKELPVKEDGKDLIDQLYRRFKEETVEDLIHRIYDFVKRLNPEVAVCTYSNQFVDLVRNESNSGVDRPMSYWNYQSEENVIRITTSYSPELSSNCAINAVDIFSRFMGVSKYLNALRLYGAMAVGGNLDWCIIGDFETYPDKENFESTKEIFHFQKKYNHIYSHMSSAADILLLRPSGMEGDQAQNEEYMGLYRILKELHFQFDVGDIDSTLIDYSYYRVIILPGIKRVSKQLSLVLLSHTVKVIGTAGALSEQPELLLAVFGIKKSGRVSDSRGSYLLTEPKEVFCDFKLKDWVYLDYDYYETETKDSVVTYMPFIQKGMFGPPERCYGYQKSEHQAISVFHENRIFYAWQVGRLYFKHGYEEFKNIFKDVWKAEIRANEPVEVTAPLCVEIIIENYRENQLLIQALNFSGIHGQTYAKPLEIRNLCVKFYSRRPNRIQSLTNDDIRLDLDEGRFEFDLKGLYSAVLIELEGE